MGSTKDIEDQGLGIFSDDKCTVAYKIQTCDTDNCNTSDKTGEVMEETASPLVQAAYAGIACILCCIISCCVCCCFCCCKKKEASQ